MIGLTITASLIQSCYSDVIHGTEESRQCSLLFHCLLVIDFKKWCEKKHVVVITMIVQKTCLTILSMQSVLFGIDKA